MSRSRKDGPNGGSHKGWAQNWKEFWSARPFAGSNGGKWVKKMTHRLERHGKIFQKFMKFEEAQND